MAGGRGVCFLAVGAPEITPQKFGIIDDNFEVRPKKCAIIFFR